MVFISAPFKQVKGENAWPEFQSVLPALETAVKGRAEQIWPGFQFGGLFPGNKRYGLLDVRPRDIFGGGTATFTKTYGSQGSWANIWSYTVPRDEIHGFAGFLVTSPSLIFAQIQMQVEDKILPIMDIEHHQGWAPPFGIILKVDQGKEIVADELQSVILRGFQERNTRNMTQRIVPLGVQAYKNKDLHITRREVSN